jgi:alpha-amylase
VFDLKHRQPALANGPWGGPQVKLETDGGDRVYAFTRTRDENTVLVALNFGDTPASVAYRGLTRPGSYTDWFTKKAVSLGEGGKIDIPPNGYRVLVK